MTAQATSAIATGEPPWWQHALGELGVREVPGEGVNPRVVLYHSHTSLASKDDADAWCSSFANFCVDSGNHRGTHKANARSWLDWGQPIDAPRLGCVVVFARPPDPKHGHVAFYVGQDAQSIYVLGGNQNNCVCVAAYPRARLLGYRWPTIAERKA